MSEKPEAEYNQQAAIERAKAIKNAHQRMLLAKANVVGVGVGLVQKGARSTGQVALIVLVSQKLPAAMLMPEDLLPGEIEGVPVEVQEVGTVRAE